MFEFVAFGYDGFRFGARRFRSQSSPEGRQGARTIARQTAAATVAAAGAAAASQRFVTLHLADDAHVSTHRPT